ncbi:DUF6603 domain-containing protein, partial [Angustibacter aerolatus]
LATGAPAVFDGPALQAFAARPAEALQARAATVAAAGLTALVEAVESVLGGAPTRSVTSAAGRVQVVLGPPTQQVVLGWTPGTGTLDAAVAVAGVPGVGAVTAGLRVGGDGVALLDELLGPAPLELADLGVLVLSPSARVQAGTSLPAPLVDLGLGAGAHRLLARVHVGGAPGLELLSGGGPRTAAPSSAPDDVVLAVVGAVLDLAGGVVLSVDAVHDALTHPVLGTASLATLLDGVLLRTAPALGVDPALTDAVADPELLLGRLVRLVANAADAMTTPLVIDGTLAVRVTRSADAEPVLGLTIAVQGARWVLNPGGDVQVSLVTDASWIAPSVPAGITLEAVRLTSDGGIAFAPGLVVGGVGVQLSRASGPLVDSFLAIDAVSLLGFGVVRDDGGLQLGGGARVELAGIAVPLAGASGGDNGVARGVMPSGGSGGAQGGPAPRFSPSLAVQRPPGGDVRVSFSAGSGGGPWWLAVQREFGPIYLEQVGLGVGQDGSTVTSISVLVDGRVSLFGLSASVDDLSLTYQVAGTGSPFDPTRWVVDVAGFAVTADVAGLTLAGGLRRFTPSEGGVEYLGMLLARLGVYGLTVYGGFGEVGPVGDRYSALFLFGAVNGPIGGPPAFFVTGIGGGFGVNRGLVVPADLSHFADFPLIKALDPAARSGDPFAELEQARQFFPASRGRFWFAAGISFTSFALVDGVVVVAVSFGDGFELDVLGLARMALPRPELPLVSIELALVARVSTREGVVLVQAQLTDNSWIIAPAVRLTGGFAFAAWFGGPNRGQFVLTLGGYHPDFHHDGYPVVPRLGLTWGIGDVVRVTGESYFALTSEALMAGMKTEVHAQLGPAWAHLVFGADGIVSFDPFHLDVTVYASIDAGVTIDLWFAEITISVHLSARLRVTGPDFHVVARFEVGPVGLTFEIGPSDDLPDPLSWAAFVAKYLEEAATGTARALTAVTLAGSVPPAGGAAAGGDTSPDGQPDRPFVVVAEFTATLTSTIPLRQLASGDATPTDLAVSHTLSVAPMGADGRATPLLLLRVRPRLTSGAGAGGPDTSAADRVGELGVQPLLDGAFPIGAWGAAQDLTNPTVPAGDVLSAADRVQLTASARVPGTGPGETPPPDIPYRQVETGPRRVLPLLPGGRATTVSSVLAGSALLAATIDSARAATGLDGDPLAWRLLVAGGRTRLAFATGSAALGAPVLLGSLGEGLGGPAPAVAATVVTPPTTASSAVRPPRLLGLLTATAPRAVRDLPSGAAPAVRGTSVSAELLR